MKRVILITGASGFIGKALTNELLKDKDNTKIIDDYDEVYHTQPSNCIRIKPFEFRKKFSEYDNELLKVIEKLEKWKKKNNKK